MFTQTFGVCNIYIWTQFPHAQQFSAAVEALSSFYVCKCWLYFVLRAWYCEIQVFWGIKLMCYFIMHISLIHNFVVQIK